MSSEQDINQVPIQDLTPEQASHIIHSHRKVRYGTACWPCRQRKVKCDNKQPCENCVKREHPQLCSYKPNRSSASKQASVSAEGNQGKKRPHSPDDNISNDQGSDHQPEGWPQAIGDELESEGISRYVGQNSIPALLRDQPSPIDTKDGVDIRRDMRPILGLDNSAPFPLMSSKHLDQLTHDIFAELPSDREVMILFRAYKEIAHPFWGFVIDIDDLESRIMIYLEERAKNAREHSKSNRRVSASWLSILFSVMAVGSQYRDSPYHIRTRDAQRYVQISFHFLRLGNFLLRPNLDSIQALLLTGFCLLNDMKAEASWALIGMTCRLAQSLGLHRAVTSEDTGSSEMSLKTYVRRKLWWTCLWHDTLTSLSFDRPNMTNIQCCPLPLSPSSPVEGLSYLEAMYTLCQTISQKLNPDISTDYSYETILDNCRVVESIREKVYPQLRSKEACKNVVDKLQHYAIRLHTSFVISVCCRPALRQNCAALAAHEKKALADKCKDNLTETVRMFLSMHQLSFIPTRSWAFTYHGLSSAVLLGILCETKLDPEVRQLQGDLISALSAAAAKEQTSPAPEHIPQIDTDIELSGPLSRALTALKNIYDYGSLHGASGVKSESASGTRTPTGVMLPQTAQNSNHQFRMQPGFDRHQDAALAMAELQNGNNLSDYSTTMPYQPSMQQQPVSMADLPQLDPTTLAPMDLYDSIFWESPDPFYTGADMNFDFLPQAPPGQSQQQFYF